VNLSGFTFVRNGQKHGYPFLESIRSLLPLVDELIVNVPESEDDTLSAVRSIKDARLTVFESDWDDKLREGGRILSLQTNRALERCSGRWAFYLQADEIVHEDDYPLIRKALEKAVTGSNIDGISFRYLHFEGGYWQVNPLRYRRQVRIIRNNGVIESWGDACGFARKDGDKLRILNSGSRIFHYGWARPPKQMLEKNRELEKLYHNDSYISEKYDNLELHEFNNAEVCRPFRDSHPSVMREIVESAPRHQYSGGRLPYFLRKRVWQWLMKKWGLFRS
jgi:hypothetical protein